MQEQVQMPGSAQPSPAAVMPTAERPLDPHNIREAIAVLMTQGQIEMATEMADLARALHPHDPSVLAVSALVAEVTQDWFKAHALLTRLHHLQGESVTVDTWRHEIRVLRCMGSTLQAFERVQKALAQYPSDEVLHQEFDELRALCAPAAAQAD